MRHVLKNLRRKIHIASGSCRGCYFKREKEMEKDKTEKTITTVKKQ